MLDLDDEAAQNSVENTSIHSDRLDDGLGHFEEQPVKRKRGRPRKYPRLSDDEGAYNMKKAYSSIPLGLDLFPTAKKPHWPNETGEALADLQGDDEERSVDPVGEEKVTKDGLVLGGREYLVPVYRLPRHPTKYYMLAMEVCKSLGLRDSYVFFARNPSVYRINASDEDKRHFVEGYGFPNQIKGRILPIMTARSVYRALGHYILNNGQEGVDDYWTTVPNDQAEVNRDKEIRDRQKERERELQEVEAKTQLAAAYAELSASDYTRLMTKASLSASSFNRRLRAQRPSTYFDIHTNMEQYPRSTCPEKLFIEKVATNLESDKKSKGLLAEDYVVVRNAKRVYGGVGVHEPDQQQDDWVVLQELDAQQDAYPIAIVSGQHRTGIPLYPRRFGPEDAARLNQLLESQTHPAPAIILPATEQIAEGDQMPQKSYLCVSCHTTLGAEKEFKRALLPAPPHDVPIYLNTYCNGCFENYQQDKYCPFCMKCYNEQEEVAMVCCDQCDRWVHVACDPALTDELYQQLIEKNNSKFTCTLCDKARLHAFIARKSQGNTNMFRLVDNKGKTLVVPPLT